MERFAWPAAAPSGRWGGIGGAAVGCRVTHRGRRRSRAPLGSRAATYAGDYPAPRDRSLANHQHRIACSRNRYGVPPLDTCAALDRLPLRSRGCREVHLLLARCAC
eukprot:scaffold5807_cov412-Prasinococcus_capsulatus_cf.AAC.12